MSYRFNVRTGEGQVTSRNDQSGRGDRCLLTNVPITREYIRGEAMRGRLGVRLDGDRG